MGRSDYIAPKLEYSLLPNGRAFTFWFRREEDHEEHREHFAGEGAQEFHVRSKGSQGNSFIIHQPMNK